MPAFDGYILNTELVEFEVEASHEGEPEVIVVGDFINYRGSIKLIKVDSKNNQRLEGAVFELYSADNPTTPLLKNLVADKNGEILVSDLAPGEYYFVEVKAPNKYVLSEAKYVFTVGIFSRQAPLKLRNSW